MFTVKMHCFLKVLTTFYKEISETIKKIRNKKMQHIYSKS